MTTKGNVRKGNTYNHGWKGGENEEGAKVEMGPGHYEVKDEMVHRKVANVVI
jgi:hypothetical protein